MIPVAIMWLITRDWRILAGGTLLSAIIAVFGYGVVIAVKHKYVLIGIEVFLAVGAGLLIDNFVLVLWVFAGLLVFFGAWGWIRLLSQNAI
jgi:hypothetical protein